MAADPVSSSGLGNLLMISNRQRKVRIPIRKLEQFLDLALRATRLQKESVAICFVTDAQIAKWNGAYRGKNKPTDVLSFCAEKEKSEKRHTYLGDIAIAPAVAQRNARLYGRTLDRELRILILHGILHLMGYDHETDTGQMERREMRLRHVLGIA